MEQWLNTIWALMPGPMQTKLEGYVEGFWKILPNLILALLFLLIVWMVVRLVTWIVPKLMRKAGFRNALIDVARMILKVTIWVFGVLIAATIAVPTLTVAKLFAAAGVGGLAIAFAAKDTLENFFAGLMLLIREPFKKGDFIDCEGFEGKVEDITVRETHVRQTDGQVVVAPNAMFFKNPVTIRTADDLRRTTIICGVAYDEDVDQARDVILEAVRNVDSVRDDVKDVQIYAQEFGASSINFEVTWWTGSTPLDIRQSRDKVVAAVKRALDDAGIEIPFPYRTLTFKEPMSIKNMGERDSGQDSGESIAAE